MGNYYLYQIAYFITRHLPLKVAYAMSIALADCHYFLSREDRRAVESNFKVILKSEAVPPSMVKAVFRNFGKYLVDFFTMTKHVDANYIKDHIKVSNTNYLNEILAQGKGCIIVSAHLGNWELAGAVLSKLGYPLSVVALPHQDKRVNAFFNEQRSYFGTTVISSTTAIRRCLEHARANRFVAILAERDFSDHGMVMDFLGKPTLIPKGAAIFSLKTGAPIVPAFFIREDNDDFYITFDKPIYPPSLEKGKVDEKHIESLIRQYIDIIQDRIKEYPQQWLMFREFWIK